ncbi:hypothetical protein BG57_22445 [Caballeronia grimmiae]|uniref:Uncharacterized protein n=1 Tax=Caballeronia grimmiae TaxID=1071679 RepID=A0A069NHG9_9BURK|nr:hypothetical protein BG57_22445 [Caballeronia grimmiae]GGD52221.1 hypothetical protein GCM10010985_02420 [Caballeronia grimmiae]
MQGAQRGESDFAIANLRRRLVADGRIVAVPETETEVQPTRLRLPSRLETSTSASAAGEAQCGYARKPFDINELISLVKDCT